MKKQTENATKETKKFQTPHEQKVTAKAAAPEQPKAKQPKQPKAKEAKKPKAAKSSKRDAFGGLVGSRCSKINVAVIEAGKTGATVKDIATKTGEDASLVSAQLGWVVKTKANLLKRESEGKTFRYTATISA